MIWYLRVHLCVGSIAHCPWVMRQKSQLIVFEFHWEMKQVVSLSVWEWDFVDVSHNADLLLISCSLMDRLSSHWKVNPSHTRTVKCKWTSLNKTLWTWFRIDFKKSVSSSMPLKKKLLLVVFCCYTKLLCFWDDKQRCLALVHEERHFVGVQLFNLVQTFGVYHNQSFQKRCST